MVVSALCSSTLSPQPLKHGYAEVNISYKGLKQLCVKIRVAVSGHLDFYLRFQAEKTDFHSKENEVKKTLPILSMSNSDTKHTYFCVVNLLLLPQEC